MSDEQDKTRAAAGVKFSSFTKVEPEDGNPVEVVGLRDGTNVRATLTTDLIETNPNQFRDRSGRFTTAPEETESLTNQRSVNEFLWNRVQDGIAEQDTIKDKVTALEGAVGEHGLLFTMDDPEGPQFTITDGMSTQNMLSEASFITLPSVDRNGSTIALERISQGDVLRMSDGLGEFTELRIDGEPEGNVFPYNQISGDMDRLTDSIPYDFTVFVAFDPAGLATIDYVDERDAAVKEYVDAQDAAVKEYVDSSIESSGGAITTWKYVEGESSPKDGEFSFRESGNQVVLMMGNRTSEGILWVHGHGREESISFDDSFFVSVTQSDGNFNLISDVEDFEFSRKNKSNTHVYLDDAEWEIDLVDGQRYCIRIPGLLPLVKF